MTNGYRALPSVDRVLSQEPIRELAGSYSHDAVVGIIRDELQRHREGIAQGSPAPSLDDLVELVKQRASKAWGAFPAPVINATGVILHTSLGRAPLSKAALDAVTDAARGYANLEYDLGRGERGSRQAHVNNLLQQLTHAEAGLVVNNNASAVMLALAAVASGKEVIVGRGEAVEIGGRFRIPDVLRQSGAQLKEVGTTNRTYASDYEDAISENTGALLKVHTSNFRVLGFTHAPSAEELVELGTRYGVPVLHDLGSGCLVETRDYGLAHEPMPQESVAAGVDLTCFSGDKLLGGPQSGIVVGKRQYIDRLSAHPMARAVRLDKLGFAALTATLMHYIRGEETAEIPAWRMISMPAPEIRRRASRWRYLIGGSARVTKGTSTIGAGSLPGETLPTWLVALGSAQVEGGAEELAARMRTEMPPVATRIEEGHVLLDPRTVMKGEDRKVVAAVRGALGTFSGM